MPLSHDHVRSRISAKIKIFILTRAELLITLCNEIPCTNLVEIFVFQKEVVIQEVIFLNQLHPYNLVCNSGVSDNFLTFLHNFLRLFDNYLMLKVHTWALAVKESENLHFSPEHFRKIFLDNYLNIKDYLFPKR